MLAVLGLTGRLAGDDPVQPTHLRLRIGERAVLWPLAGDGRNVRDEMLAAVADMVANASQLERSGRDPDAWAHLLLLDPSQPRTRAAFEVAQLMDGLAEYLLGRPVLRGLETTTGWRRFLTPLRPEVVVHGELPPAAA
ncbi:MAG: hypothetical protein ACJ761_03640 [Chloroflexota bacterium]